MGVTRIGGTVFKGLTGSGIESELVNKLRSGLKGSGKSKSSSYWSGYGQSTGNTGSTALNMATQTNKQINGSTPTRGKSDGNALTHDVTAAEGGTTTANARSVDDILAEMRAQRVRDAKSHEQFISGFKTKAESYIKKTLSPITDTAKDTDFTSIKDTDDLGLVMSDEQVIKTGETTDIKKDKGENKKSGVVSDIENKLSGGLLDRAKYTAQALGTLFTGAGAEMDENGRELPKILGGDSDGTDLGLVK